MGADLYPNFHVPPTLGDVLCLVTQLCLTLCNPRDFSPPGSSVHGDSPGKNTGVGCHFLLQGNLPNPGIKPRSPALQADSFPSEPPGKPTLVDGEQKKVGLVTIVGCFGSQHPQKDATRAPFSLESPLSRLCQPSLFESLG